MAPNPHPVAEFSRENPMRCLGIAFLNLADPLSVQGTGCDESYERLRSHYIERGWKVPLAGIS